MEFRPPSTFRVEFVFIILSFVRKFSRFGLCFPFPESGAFVLHCSFCFFSPAWFILASGLLLLDTPEAPVK